MGVCCDVLDSFCRPNSFDDFVYTFICPRPGELEIDRRLGVNESRLQDIAIIAGCAKMVKTPLVMCLFSFSVFPPF